jgi:hypothetical protein
LNPRADIEIVQVAVLFQDDARVFVLTRPSLDDQAWHHGNTLEDLVKPHNPLVN